MSQLVVYQNKANPAIDAIALDASASLNAGEYALLKDAHILRFGSSPLISEPARSKLYQAIDFAAEQNAIISYAPRIDPAQWPMHDDPLRILRSPIVTADVIQVFPAELPFLTGESEPEAAADVLSDQGVRLVFVMGHSGVLVRFGREQRKISFTGTCDSDVFLDDILSRIATANMPLKRIALDDIMGWTHNAITFSCK
jgi:sugar/nucleoside kinase (ribokinase family)